MTAFRPAYWQALLVVSVLYFGRFDFAWVTLRAQTVRSTFLCLLDLAVDTTSDQSSCIEHRKHYEKLLQRTLGDLARISCACSRSSKHCPIKLACMHFG